jgi:carboxymethylenebutenolidase
MAVPGEVTDRTRIQTEEVTFQSDGATIDAYLARPRGVPSGSGTRGGVIVIHEAFGPVEHIFDLARRFANVGFNALAPNLYARVGAPDLNNMATLMPKMLGLPDAQIVRDLEATAAYLRAQEGANSKVGCIGFCSGGRQTLLFACSSDKVDAAVDCWGGFLTSATPTEKTSPARPTPVIDLVPNLRCPLLAVFGAEDTNPSPADAAELERRLNQAGKDATVKSFPNAGHAFLADYRPSYVEKAAFELWPQVISFFESHLP